MTVFKLILEIIYIMEKGDKFASIRIKVGQVNCDNSFFTEELKGSIIILYFSCVRDKVLYVSTSKSLSSANILLNILNQIKNGKLNFDDEITEMSYEA